MRTFKTLVALAGAVVLLLAGCTTKEQEIAVTGITLTPSTITLNVGESQSLTAEVQPTNATNKKINWSTSDPEMSVIALSGNTVKGLAPGSATVIVTSDDGGRTATCQVTVKESGTPGPGPGPDPGKVDVSAVTLKLEGSSSLVVGESVVVKATVEPDNATEADKLSWSSDKPEVASVSGNAKEATITAVAEGKAKITATVDGKSATVEVTVVAATVAVESITLEPSSATLKIGEEASFTAKVTPADATHADGIEWSISDEAMAELSASGKEAKVKGLATGTVTLTAKVDGKEAKAKISIEPADIAVESITLEPTSATLNIGEEASFVAKVTPADATHATEIEWSISNPAVAELKPAGSVAQVKALAEGSATLTAAVDGKSVTASITVNAAQVIPEGFVDMGLPSGTLWAQENLGTDSGHPLGQYYAWGETEPKSSYTKDNYRFGNPWDTSTPLSKYNESDGLSLLEPEDDAATVLLGEGYRTPTLGEWNELLNSSCCSREWTTQDGINGILFTSLRNGQTLFLPAAGYFSDAPYQVNGSAYYWSATKKPWEAYAYEFANLLLHETSLHWGESIRPVYAPRPTPSTGITAPESVEVEKGKPYQLKASVQPASALQSIYWKTNADALELNPWTGEVVVKYGNGGTVYAVDGTGGHQAEITVKVKASYPVPEAVDLGLKSGTKWASWDLGASKTEEPGLYFAWGETEPKVSFYDYQYKWYDADTDTYTKYDENDRFLEPEDDAARVHLGGAWCIPSRDQFEELYKSCIFEKTNVNGQEGHLVTGPNGNQIFLPFGGYMSGEWIFYGAIATSYFYQINESDIEKSGTDTYYYSYYFNVPGETFAPIGATDRYDGNCIRAVIPGDQSVSPAAQVRSLGPVGFGHKSNIEQQRQQQERGPKARRGMHDRSRR